MMVSQDFRHCRLSPDKGTAKRQVTRKKGTCKAVTPWAAADAVASGSVTEKSKARATKMDDGTQPATRRAAEFMRSAVEFFCSVLF